MLEKKLNEKNNYSSKIYKSKKNMNELIVFYNAYNL